MEDYPLSPHILWKDYTKEEWEQRLHQLPRVWRGGTVRGKTIWYGVEKRERVERNIKRMREVEAEIRRRQEAGESITDDGE